ncbi:glycosyltransferase family 9 protein [Candidatus Thioglobus sp.]|nr:glycosyltransferase family 9 protein [Candidatus Thioglobus sp.]
MKNPKKILIIIQRSNGDVLLSSPLINSLYDYYNMPEIDLLVNDDTLAVSELLPNVNLIHSFSYQQKNERRISQEKEIFLKIYRKYDLSISLTASDRSVIYALLASRKSIGAVEKENKKSWWKKRLLKFHYFFDETKHILSNNLEPLNLLHIEHKKIIKAPEASQEIIDKIKNNLAKRGVNKFFIFHPSAQYNYKVYPKKLRHELLELLSKSNISVIITGGNTNIDQLIKKSLPDLKNVINWIGQTSIKEYLALSKLSDGYIGMDTLNMHIAAAQNKRIFAIYGPTRLSMWSPWSNELQVSTMIDMPIQTYGKITIFQADMPCVACGKAGCNDNNGLSECLDNISPLAIASEVKKWLKDARI